MAVTLAEFVTEVEKFKNSPYIWGGTSPSGFDCSGLIYYSLHQLGISNVPRTSEEQWSWAQHINQSQLQPGDLVFANFPGEVSPGHVGIYVGNGNVYSAQDQKLGIGTVPLSSWGSAIVGYGRIPGIDATGTNQPQQANTASALGGVFSWPADITGFFKDTKTFIDALLWIVNPASWLRIGSFAIGMILLAAALYALMKVGSDEPMFKMPTVVPIPV